eukprot:63565-Rhodomonas_salina.6
MMNQSVLNDFCPLPPCPTPPPFQMQKTTPSPDKSWNVGRFAKTFTFFNGNPILKLIPFVPSG